MAADPDLELALSYLVGRVTRSGGTTKTSFKLTADEENAARAAIARLLDQPRPPRSLLGALAALFDPDDGLRAQRRKLVLRGRGKGAPRDAAREIDLIVQIRVAHHNLGGSVEGAIAEVAERTGMTEGGLWDVWNRNPRLREIILNTTPRS